MAYNTTDTIKGRVAGLLKKTTADLGSYWDNIVSDSRTRAYNEIISRLTGRGFTVAQINTWDRAAEFELDIAIYWCLVSGAGLSDPDDKYINRFDRRMELDDVWLTASGVAIDIASLGVIGTGALSDDTQTFKRQVDGAGTITETRW